MKIEILDAAECELSKRDAQIIAPCLSFEASYWVQGPHKKSRKTYQKQVFSHKGQQTWRFYTGLLQRVLDWCSEHNVAVQLVGDEFYIERQCEPNLRGITFRDDQLDLIDKACKHQRGIIQSGTGTGKTIMQLGVISCYPDCNILILAHTTAIVKQTFDKLKEFGFKNIEMFGGGEKARKPVARITVSTMQSFSKLNPLDYIDYYDGIIIDEAHHVQSIDSTYAKILSKMLAPMRLGFTATKRTTPEAVLVNEGLLGPTIGKLTIKEATELGILAEPKLKFIKAKCDHGIMDIRNFQDSYKKIRVNGALVNGERTGVGVYTYGIVENEKRNRQIVEIIDKFKKQNKTTLIFVTQIEHGNILSRMIGKAHGDIIPFVQGSMSMDEREKTKKKLLSKELLVCIATTSWTEGVDIPNLDCVVMAGGGKSEIQTLQRLGRGLRKTSEKDTVTIVDFLDLSHFHLIRQTGERLATYSEQGWL